MRAIVPLIAIIHRILLAAVCACGFGLLLCRPSFAAAPVHCARRSGLAV